MEELESGDDRNQFRGDWFVSHFTRRCTLLRLHPLSWLHQESTSSLLHWLLSEGKFLASLLVASFVYVKPQTMTESLISSGHESKDARAQPKIWWSNAIFFSLIHIFALVGIYYAPPWSVRRETLLLWFVTWQLSDFGYVHYVFKARIAQYYLPPNIWPHRITIGYHRLYSHKAFRASLSVRVVLAILGSSAFQGSIKVG